MNNLSVQEVFLKFYRDYAKQYNPSAIQQKTAFCIINCKTGGFGVNTSVCEDCGSIQLHFNSCRNRCCPMCQELPKQQWMDARREDVLDAPYFHVVFTLPEELNPIIYSNQRRLYDLMYHAVSDTLEELSADPDHLGAKVGYICILHTWGSVMNYHPHIHVILLGGGLNHKNHWCDNGYEFFLPVPVLSEKFRGKYLDGLKKLWKEKKLIFNGCAEPYRNRYHFSELLNTCYSKGFVVYSKKTFQGAQSVIEYLGKYTHRIAISNYRLLDMNEDGVTYSVKDYTQAGKWKELKVSGVEFIRRFLVHVPPMRFVRIRHYGLLSSRIKQEKLTLCRNLLGCQKYLSVMRNMTVPEMLRHLYGIDILICKDCGGHMIQPKVSLHRKI